MYSKRQGRKRRWSVLIAIKRVLFAKKYIKAKNVELIAAQINITDTKFLVIISAYRPPNKNDIDYLKQMIIEINELKLKFKNSTFWLGGDFNLPDIKWPEQNISGSMYSKELNEAFIDMLNNLGIEQMVDFPTRKDNILDLFCTNQPALITKIKSIPGISDHDIVLVDAICKPQRSKQSQHKIYLWKKVDIKKIKDVTSHFISELISQTNENLNIDQLWNKFKEGSNKIIDDNVPSKITKSKYTNPWANRDIDHLCKKQRKAYNKAKKTGKQEHKDKYKKVKSYCSKRNKKSPEHIYARNN
ncbi:unnamed protein product [Mytilus edulis]|uniref:Endonuclease/exonuclease/phosphatase domain-containing protein n=1 Tax=Mytilus edulis TaxID=6550 RepID=A0A8S3R7M5_MYTED|nr:unnamed protein product [Mytilus edulis]